ncbi:MAG: hypothetical protein ACOCZV_02140, partial [Nanoarchaeota archaeon]
KRLRQQRLIQENAIYVMRQGFPGHQQLLKRLLAELYEGRITIVEPDDPRAETASPLQAKPLEECAGEGLDYFLECKSVDTLRQKAPNPLKYCSNKECKQLAVMYGITEPLQTRTHDLIEAMHEKYPQTKSSVLKSLEAIQQRLS